MLLSVNAFALPVFSALEVALIGFARVAVAAGFIAINMGLAAFGLRHFMVRQRAGPNAALEARFLIHTARHIGRHALRCCSVRVPGHRVVLVSCNVAADLVLRCVQPYSLCSGQLAVLRGFCLQAGVATCSGRMYRVAAAGRAVDKYFPQGTEWPAVQARL